MDIQDSFSNSEDPLSAERDDHTIALKPNNPGISGISGLQEKDRNAAVLLHESSKFDVINRVVDKPKRGVEGKASDGVLSDGTIIASDNSNNFSSKHTRDSIAFEGSLSRRLFIQA